MQYFPPGWLTVDKGKEENEAIDESIRGDCEDEKTETTGKDGKTAEPDPTPLPDTCEFHHRDEVLMSHSESWLNFVFRCLVI